MGQRNMLCLRQMLDVEMEPGHSLLRPEPCLVMGHILDFPNTNYQPVLLAPGNTGNLDLRHLPSHNDSSVYYRNQYNNLQHHHPIANLDLAVPLPNFLHNPYMIPSSANGSCPISLNRGTPEHIPSSSNSRVFGVGLEAYNRTTHFMDNGRGSCKRKNAAGNLGNHYVNGLASSSSSLGVQWEEPYGVGVGVLNAPAIPTSDYRGSGVFSIAEGSQRSVRSRSSGAGLHLDSSMAHHHYRFSQQSYMARPVQSASNGRVEQLGSHGYAAALPALHTGLLPSGRSINGGSTEIGDIASQAYQDNMSNRTSGIISCSSAHHNHHHHPFMHSMGGGQSYIYHSQLSAPLYRHSSNHHLHHGALSSSQDGIELGSRYHGSFPSSGEQINRLVRRGPQAPPEESNAHVRILSSEDVMVLDFSGFYGVGNFIDQHRDMRLDIDGMSYEELLALEERIGDVKTGLSEESISKYLKTRIHLSCAAPSADQSVDMAQENGSCIICQVEYEDQEKIATLDCGHEYHANCIKEWLLMKNVCPICKAHALAVDKQEG